MPWLLIEDEIINVDKIHQIKILHINKELENDCFEAFIYDPGLFERRTPQFKTKLELIRYLMCTHKNTLSDLLFNMKLGLENEDKKDE